MTIITARGGSKRLPGKNSRPLGGKPLIEWSIDAATEIPGICDILVSTDCPQIAEISRQAGATVPWLRPTELASDTASSIDVCLHALDWYESQHDKVDGVMLLQPTSPFRSRNTILSGIHLFKSEDNCSVIAVSSAKSHPLWCFKMKDRALQPFINDEGLLSRSQDLEPAYVINGAFYLATPDTLRNDRSFYGNTMCPLIIDNPKETLDIDTEWDWKLAEAILGMK
ncbi:MAG: acylneuraminate cytidylyltransferase family protein [Legionella sp.]|nr:acylneuraminate cytidylyltransferase family protein [Legionella sp.]